jgi:RimJ/RimL family protein N-acetyltransferase
VTVVHDRPADRAPTLQGELGTGSVRLRRYTVSDAPSVAEAVCESLAQLRPWMPWAHARYTPAESQAWIELQVSGFERGTAYEYAIVSAGGEYLGGCGLNQVDTVNRRANLGYWVRSGAANRGVATAAVELLREWAFQETDLIRLEILVAVENAASQRVAEKSGAVREGTLRSRLILHGSVHDATIFSFVRP